MKKQITFIVEGTNPIHVCAEVSLESGERGGWNATGDGVTAWAEYSAAACIAWVAARCGFDADVAYHRQGG